MDEEKEVLQEVEQEEVVVEKKKRQTLFPLPVVFGAGIAALLIMLAVFAGQVGLQRRLKASLLGVGEIWMRSTTATVNENTELTVEIGYINPTGEEMRFQLYSSVRDDTATEGDDYEEVEKTYVISSDDEGGVKEYNVKINDDTIVEGDEKFTLGLRRLDSKTEIRPGLRRMVVTIIDDDEEEPTDSPVPSEPADSPEPSEPADSPEPSVTPDATATPSSVCTDIPKTNTKSGRPSAYHVVDLTKLDPTGDPPYNNDEETAHIAARKECFELLPASCDWEAVEHGGIKSPKDNMFTKPPNSECEPASECKPTANSVKCNAPIPRAQTVNTASCGKVGGIWSCVVECWVVCTCSAKCEPI